jgi:flagellin-specific chaperone FliS
VAALVAYANEHFELAQAALRAGDFATYGQEIAKVQDALRQLDALVKLSPAP